MSVGLLIHIPHASVYVPPVYKNDFLLPPDQLSHEIYWWADIYCDELYNVNESALLIARQSRLVCDVERFRDDEQELMSAKGNGLYYTHTLAGKPLRENNPVLRKKIVADIYDPHHKCLTQKVDELLKNHDTCLIIDGHSFGREAWMGDNLPDFCIGVDTYHTPKKLEETAHQFFRSLGFTTETNRPFAGAITPLKYYRKDKRVLSMMIETNKRLYVKEDRVTKLKRFDEIKNACMEAIQACIKCVF